MSDAKSSGLLLCASVGGTVTLLFTDLEEVKNLGDGLIVAASQAAATRAG
jgi:hypothetical protein